MKKFFSRVAGVTHENRDNSSRQEYIRKYCRQGMYLYLRPEPDNPQDSSATAVYVTDPSGQAYQVGYVTAEANREVERALGNETPVNMRIVNITGGSIQKPSKGINVEIEIDGDPVDPMQNNAKVRTNQKNAVWGCVGLITMCLIIYGMYSFFSDIKTHQENTARCVPATPAQLAMINAGVKGMATYNDVRTGWAVKSADFANVSMIAARVYGPSMEQGSPPGVWAVGGTPDAPNGMFSVNAFANNFSDWGDAGTIKAPITLSADGVKAAIWCVESMK